MNATIHFITIGSNKNEKPRPIAGLLHVLVLTFILSFAFDTKGVVGGTAEQYVMAAINGFVFLLLGRQFRFVLPKRGYVALTLYVWLTFIFVGSLGALVSGVPLDQYIRIVYPFVLFGEGFLLIWWLAHADYDLGKLIQAMYVGAGISVIYTLWWGFHFSGDVLNAIRYQIVSPVAMFLLIVAASDLVLFKKRQVMALIWIFVVVAAFTFSVTRSYVLIIVGVFSALILAVLINSNRRSGVAIPKAIVGLFAFSVLIGVVILMYLFMYPDVAGRWELRTFGPYSDVTYWTRIATVVDEWRQTTAKPTSILLGLGFGHGFVYSAKYASLLLPYTGQTVFSQPSWYAAEFMYMTPLFYSGFIIGLAVVLSLFRGAQHAFKVLRDLLRTRLWQSVGAQSLWIGILGYFAFLFEGLAGNPFVYRYSAMYFGLCLGLVASYRRYHRTNRSRQ